MKYTIVLIISLFAICSCDDNIEYEKIDTVGNFQNKQDTVKLISVKENKLIQTNVYSNSPEIKFLDSIYENNLPYLKKVFFREWYKKSKQEDIKNVHNNDSLTKAIRFFFNNLFFPDIDTTKKFVYASGYYNPVLKKYINNIQSTGCFVKAKYFVLRPAVTCYIFDDSTFQLISKAVPYGYENRYKKKVEKVCYYPKIKFKNKKKLYLTEEYETILDSFIQAKFNREDISSKFIVNERRKFLSPEIELSKMHSWYFYHYETFPKIRLILFNESFNQANVQLRTSFNRGGYAIYRKKMNTWRCEEYKRFTWIQ